MFCLYLGGRNIKMVAFNLLRALSFIAQCQRPPFVSHGSVIVPPLLCTLCYCAHWRWGFGVWRGSAVIRFYEMRLFVVLHFLVLCLAGILWVRILCHRSRRQLCTCDAVIVVMSLCLWMHL